jgi:hypothetical protein
MDKEWRETLKNRELLQIEDAMKTWNRKRREEIRRKKMENDYYAEYEVIEGKGRKVYHVVYQDEVWKVKQERGYTIANGKFDNKAEAVERAKEAAKRAKLGQVIVHKRDGKFQTEYTYGDDPKESKG